VARRVHRIGALTEASEGRAALRHLLTREAAYADIPWSRRRHLHRALAGTLADGGAAPASARDTAQRIGWQAHTVAKRCENIRDRYVRLGVPGLRGPRALDELARLLISTGELTAADLRRLPAKAPSG
jgi:hypothetical protein